jgi:hypothetical protein
LKDLLEAGHVVLGLAEMRLKRLFELRIVRLFDHFRECLHDLLLGVIDVAQHVHEQAIHRLDVFGKEAHESALPCGLLGGERAECPTATVSLAVEATARITATMQP